MNSPGNKPVTVTLPDIDQHALRQASKGQARLAHLLANHQADFASLVISGLSANRLYYAVQFWSFDGGDIKRRPTKLTKIILDEVVGCYAGMARHIIKRYPENSRPTTVVMGSDGQSLMFNPGRISAEGTEWLLDHVEGKSPAALIIAKNSLLNQIAQQ